MPPDKTPGALRELHEWFDRWRSEQSPVTLGGAAFRLTSIACPEQYDVDLDEARNRGYVRLRHGELTADYLPDGDFDRRVQVFERYLGEDAPCFESNEERAEYLTQIAEKLYARHRAHTVADSDEVRSPAASPRREEEPPR